MNTQHKRVTQECTVCGHQFDLMYHSNGTYTYVDEPCECEAEFIPLGPSLAEWLETVSEKSNNAKKAPASEIMSVAQFAAEIASHVNFAAPNASKIPEYTFGLSLDSDKAPEHATKHTVCTILPFDKSDDTLYLLCSRNPSKEWTHCIAAVPYGFNREDAENSLITAIMASVGRSAFAPASITLTVTKTGRPAEVEPDTQVLCTVCEEGICPICGNHSKPNYGNSEWDDEGYGHLDWDCEKCGANGTAVYGSGAEGFIEHIDVSTKDEISIAICKPCLSMKELQQAEAKRREAVERENQRLRRIIVQHLPHDSVCALCEHFAQCKQDALEEDDAKTREESIFWNCDGFSRFVPKEED